MAAALIPVAEIGLESLLAGGAEAAATSMEVGASAGAIAGEGAIGSALSAEAPSFVAGASEHAVSGLGPSTAGRSQLANNISNYFTRANNSHMIGSSNPVTSFSQAASQAAPKAASSGGFTQAAIFGGLASGIPGMFSGIFNTAMTSANTSKQIDINTATLAFEKYKFDKEWDTAQKLGLSSPAQIGLINTQRYNKAVTGVLTNLRSVYRA